MNRQDRKARKGYSRGMAITGFFLFAFLASFAVDLFF